jgi:hypothetical protein
MKRKEDKESNHVKFDIAIGKRCRGLYIRTFKIKTAKKISLVILRGKPMTPNLNIITFLKHPL